MDAKNDNVAHGKLEVCQKDVTDMNKRVLKLNKYFLNLK